jgi:hypothetical protein
MMIRRSTDRNRAAAITGAAVAAAVLASSLAAGQSGGREATCKTIQQTIERTRTTLDGPEGLTRLLSDKYREMTVLDAVNTRMGGQTLERDRFLSTLRDVSAGELVPPDLTRWARGIEGTVSPQIVAAQRAATQARITDLEARKSEAEGQIRQLRQRQLDMNCDVSTPSGPDTNTPSVESTPKTTESTGPSDQTTAPPVVAGAVSDWAYDWTHDFGTISFVSNLDLTLVNGLDETNAYGAGIGCDGTGVFLGTAEWSSAGGGFSRPWVASRVTACMNGSYLEGKISSYGSGAAAIYAASFKIAFSAGDRKTFAGTYRIYNPATRQTSEEMPWSGKRN